MSEALFKDPVHLSELHTYPAADSLFVLGEVLAEWNAAGQFFYPDFLNNFMFHRNNGLWMMISANNRHEKALDPEVASWQFRGPVSEMRKEFLAGFLGGYVRRAYQIIEPKYPGFTDQVLAHLVSGPILSITKPREIQLDLSKIISTYGFKIFFNKDSPGPTLAEAPQVWQNCNDYELVLATIVITMAGMDVTKWINQVEQLDATTNMPKILGGFVRREYKSSWDGAIADIFGLNKKQKQFEDLVSSQPAPIGCLLLFVQDIFSLDKVPDDGIAGEAFEILEKTFFNLMDKQIPDWYGYIEAVVDGLNYLAQEADQKGDTLTSMRLAEDATILLQFLIEEDTGMEARLSRTELLQYSWTNLLTDSSAEPYLLLSYISFRNTLSGMYLNCFATSHKLLMSGKVSNHLWTAMWISRRMQRATLIFLNDLSSQVGSWTEDDKFVFHSVLKQAFETYLSGQRQFTAALTSFLQTNQIPSHYTNIFTGMAEEDAQTFLHIEQAATLKFYKVLEADTLDAKTILGLQELVTAIKSVE